MCIRDRYKELFRITETTYKAFEKFNTSRQTLLVLDGLSLGLIAGGAYLLASRGRTDACSDTNGEISCGFTGTLLIINGSVLALASNGIIMPIKLKRKKEMIRSYLRDIEYQDRRTGSIEMNFGFQGSGVGLALRF